MAFAVYAGAAWGVWAYLRRADREAALAITTAAAERVAAAETAEGATARKRERARDKAIRKADGWATRARAALVARRCGKASWMSTALTAVVGLATGNQDPQFRFAPALFGCLILLAAIGLVIFALTSILRHGRKGLLMPALVALGLNAAISGFAVRGLMARPDAAPSDVGRPGW